ncbi:MAG: SAM-dependent DNA methyltransferase [Nitrospirae bacterium]|nr:SAM-dependent DNA methyltransferase [Nitrospirota bacterium]
MQWVAPSEKDTATDTLEKKLWDAADQFRANSGLTSAQYSAPVLGLIFLRFAEVRFNVLRSKLEKAGQSSRRSTSRIDEPAAYHAEGVIYLTPNARFDSLLSLPEGGNIGKTINEAMRDIEKHNPQLAGVLPKTYEIFSGTLLKELLKKVSEIPATIDYDAFGRIYEYFLGEFARTEGQKGGEFYTPASIVRLLVEIIEPYHGRILDPACGSGGMFVQSARFVAEHKKNPSSELSIHGQEKVAATIALCRMNLAMHGLEGDIREAITYYDDLHQSTGRFDFLLANPPFNVNAVDKERLEAEVGKGRRYPFGLPRTDNANYLWIQLFYSALNEKGRAGFVMANSASDARSSEQDLRRKLLDDNAVDVMVAVGLNLFYTVTLPCTLWFFDRGKKNLPPRPLGERAGVRGCDTVLFIDARHIYRQIDRAHRDWADVQIGFLANIVRLYRGEEPDFTLGGDEAKAKLEEVFGSPTLKKGAAKKVTPSPLGGEGGGEGYLQYRDIPGLCKVATLKEIEAQGWSLNPGRYVGVAPGEVVSDEDFKEKLETLNEELEVLNAQARELEATIARNVAEILES